MMPHTNNRSRAMVSMMTAGDVATLLHVHINTIRRWSRLGALKSYKLGNRGGLRFNQEDINALLKSHNRHLKEVPIGKPPTSPIPLTPPP